MMTAAAAMNNSDPRELTREERAAIRKLVTSLCANHDYEQGCLLLDGPCFMFGKWWTGGFCKYFRDAVLPTDPALEAALTDGAVDMRPCAVCRKPFIVSRNQAYCSPVCADRARKKRQRGYMQKKRGNS